MRDYRITAIRLDGDDRHRLIDALRIEGTLWPIDTVIGWITSGTHSFWIEADGCRLRVVAARHGVSGRTFLTTEGTGFPPVHLLGLRRTC